MNDSQHRAWDALELGPLWRSRRGEPALLGWPDASGSWLFATTSSDGGPSARELRLLTRIVSALDLRIAAEPFRFDAGDAPAAALRVVVAFGEAAAHALSGRGVPDACRLGGHEVPLVVTLGLARLLGSPHEKAGVWADLCRARDAQLPRCSDSGP